MLIDAGLREVKVGVGARKAGDPFTVLIASGQKPVTGAYAPTKNTKLAKQSTLGQALL
jgi:hypothetical protein